jgi:hypothetical protein
MLEVTCSEDEEDRFGDIGGVCEGQLSSFDSSGKSSVLGREGSGHDVFFFKMLLFIIYNALREIM